MAAERALRWGRAIEELCLPVEDARRVRGDEAEEDEERLPCLSALEAGVGVGQAVVGVLEALVAGLEELVDLAVGEPGRIGLGEDLRHPADELHRERRYLARFVCHVVPVGGPNAVVDDESADR